MASVGEWEELIRDTIRAIQYEGWRRMLTGYKNTDGSVTMAGAPTGKVWVRPPEDSRGGVAVWGSASQPNAPVWVGPGPDGDLEIKDPDWQEAVSRIGEGARVITQPPGMGELLPDTVPIKHFKPGRVELSPNGGLNIRVAHFWHPGGRWDSDADQDMTSFVPGTVNEVCWVVPYLNPNTNTVTAVASTPVFGEAQDLDEADVESITIPAGMIPLGAFTLRNAQTSIANSRFADDDRRVVLSSWDNSGGSGGSGGASLERITATPLYENLAPTSGRYDLSNSAFDDYDRLELWLNNAESTINATADSGHIEFATGGGALDTTAGNYYTQNIGGSNGAAVNAEANNQVGFIVSGSSASTPAGYASSVKITIFNPGDTSFHKRCLVEMVVARDSANMDVRFYSFFWRNTGAIDRIGLKIFNDPTSTFTSTTRLTIIGYKKEAIGGVTLSDANVSNPPTDAEITAAFGTQSDGFEGLIDDNGAGTTVWRVIRKNSKWWYWSTTEAT